MKSSIKKFFWLLIILGILFLGYNFMSGGTLFYIGGQTPLSISTINIYNTDGTLNAKTIAYIFRSGGLSGWVQGDFSKDVINNILPDNQGNVNTGFKFESGISSEKCSYPMQFVTSNSIQDYKLFRYQVYHPTCTQIDLIWGCLNATTVSNFCQQYSNSVGGYFVKGFYSDSGVANCIYKVQDGGAFAEFLTPKYQFILSSKLTINGQAAGLDTIVSGNIGTDQLPSQQTFSLSGFPVAYLTWQGNLSTGTMCEVVNTAQKKIINLSSNNDIASWRVFDYGYYSTYLSSNNAIESLSTSTSKTNVDNAISTQNNARQGIINNAAQNANIIGTNQLSFTSSTQQGNAGAAYYTPSIEIYRPIFTLFIKADSLGFYQPKPIVSNLSATATTQQATSGGSIPIRVSWTNSGDDGSFNVVVNCQGAFYNTQPSYERWVAKGQTQTDTINAQATCQQDTPNQSCSVSVSAISVFGGNTLTQNVSGLTCKKVTQCEGSSRLCENESTLKICTNGEWVASICPIGQTCNNGYCVQKSCPFGQELFKGNCVGLCPLGQNRNQETGICEGGTPPSCQTNPNTDECQCRLKSGDGLFITGYTWNTGGLIGGLYRSPSCDPIYNWSFILITIVIIGGLVFTIIFYSRKR